MKNCEYWQQQISRLLDGDLSPEEEAALWEHIADCPDCAQAYEDFAQQASVLRAQVVRPPVDLSRLVMARIKNGQLDPASFHTEKPVSHRLRSWKKLAVAACFVVLVAAAAVTGVFSRGVPMSGGGETASYLPTAQNDTVYARVPENAAPDQAPAQQDQAPAEAPADEAQQVRSLPEPAAVTEEAAVPDGAPSEPNEAAADTAGSAESADSGIMPIMEPPVSPAEGGAPCLVSDAAGQPLGYIGDAAALQALLTGEPWQGEAPEPVCALTLDGADYAFAADENGSLLWQRGGGDWILSPAALADLQALITAE